MHPIKPHLWFNNQAKEAAEFYVSLLPNSAISFVSKIANTPNGDCDIVEFTLAGQPLMAISAGPHFKFTPAISLMVNFDPSREAGSSAQIDEMWNKLLDGGSVLMPLDSYPFSERYGWIADKYGLNWQLILSRPEGEPRPVIVPSLLFTGDVAGKALEAIDFYCSIFKGGHRGNIAPRPEDVGPDKAGTLMYGDFNINDTWIAAMDSAHPHGFVFNEALSFLVECDTQEEIDYYFNALSNDPKAEQCGWLKDKYGVSWQITASMMTDVFKNGTQEQIDRVTKAFMPMKKIDAATLEKAYRGK
ncbi:VOC family protein [Mucilaginibacter ginkgonis]|uniref:VOC family protein n=1 Tax=Mucilaginibacter ginkgonis TaxID=2682091 RepID=A0A6I4INX7_9SPHI|nr:VOC family protein [Mucilaginibacter ginkgonis]QQL50516.1 VOC family protein [Mucilaginibacter ginkgonis]